MGLLLLALLSCALAASSTSVPLPLAPGVEMPIVGLGTGSYGQLAADGSTTYGEYWNDTVAERAVAAFIAAGGRRLDCSLKWYHDLAGVGRGMAASGLPREQLFVTSKVDDPFGYSEALASVRASLAMLNTSYVDLVLMHWPAPMAWDFETTAFDTRLVYNQSGSSVLSFPCLLLLSLARLRDAGAVSGGDGAGTAGGAAAGPSPRCGSGQL
jgi:diketogulonate reductase-like aldo/keto reductase